MSWRLWVLLAAGLYEKRIVAGRFTLSLPLVNQDTPGRMSSTHILFIAKDS